MDLKSKIGHALDWFDDRVLNHRLYWVCQWLGRLEWYGEGICPEGCKSCAYWKELRKERLDE